MEEILASIRLIISDDAKRGPVERDEIRTFHSPAPRNDAPPPAMAAPEEEVFDLTEELVFPEDQHKPVAAAPAQPHAAEPVSNALVEETAVEEHQALEHAPATSHEPAVEVEPAPELHMAGRPEYHFQPAAQPDYPVQRQEAPSRPSQTHSRPIWSRRELPGSPPPVASASTRMHEAALSRQQQPRSWADDIQMPIPDRGPVPLISTGRPRLISKSLRGNRAAAEIEAYSAAAVRKAEALLDSAKAAVNAEGVSEEGRVSRKRLRLQPSRRASPDPPQAPWRRRTRLCERGRFRQPRRGTQDRGVRDIRGRDPTGDSAARSKPAANSARRSASGGVRAGPRKPPRSPELRLSRKMPRRL